MKMWGLEAYLSPKRAYCLAQSSSPWLLLLAVLAWGYGLYGALYAAPVDYQQGDVYRIIYIHVPCAVLSLSLYTVMAVSSFIYLVWKVKVMDALSAVCAPMGALLTVLTLITGSVWGKPTWGTWWVWDARLTSELVLFFIYCGIIALRYGLAQTQSAGQAVAAVVLIGAINIPIIHYSVDWWQTLHQGASILQWSSPKIAATMLHPLLACMVGMMALVAYILSFQLRAELLERHENHRWVQQLESFLKK
jgi:heme exporter protein C